MPIHISEVMNAARTSDATNSYFSLKTFDEQCFLESRHIDILKDYHLNYKFVFEGNLNILLYPEHSEIKCRFDRNRVINSDPRGTIVRDNISYCIDSDLYDFSKNSIQNVWGKATTTALQDIQKHADALAKRDTQAHNERFLQKRTPYKNTVSRCQEDINLCLHELEQLKLELEKTKSERRRALARNTKTQKAELTANEQAQLTMLRKLYRHKLDKIRDAQDQQDLTLVEQLQKEKAIISNDISRLENKTEQVSAPALEQLGNYFCAGVNVASEIKISKQLSEKQAELEQLKCALIKAEQELSAFDNQYPETHYHYNQQAISDGYKYLLKEASITISPASKESVRHLVSKDIINKITKSMYQNIALCVLAVACSIGVIAYLGYSAYVWAMLTLMHPEAPVMCIKALSLILMFVAVIIGYSYANAYVNVAETEILKHASDIAQGHYQTACSEIKGMQPTPSAPLLNPNETTSTRDDSCPPVYN